MATKRMFSNNIIDKDAFVDLSPSAQLLYFHLGMKTDDDGFVAQARKIANLIGATNGELEELIDTGFIIPFPTSKVFLITHFLINNNMKNDRYNKTDYQKEWAMIEINENKEYKLKTGGSTMYPNDIQSGSDIEPQPSVTQPIVTQPNEAKLNETQQSGGKGSVEGKPLYDYETLLAQSNLWGIDKKRMIEFINVYGINEAYKELRRWHDANENPTYFGKSYKQ